MPSSTGNAPTPASEFDLEIEEVDITRDPALQERYRYTIPVVVIDGKYSLSPRSRSTISGGSSRRDDREGALALATIEEPRGSRHPGGAPAEEIEDFRDIPLSPRVEGPSGPRRERPTGSPATGSPWPTASA